MTSSESTPSPTTVVREVVPGAEAVEGAARNATRRRIPPPAELVRDRRVQAAAVVVLAALALLIWLFLGRESTDNARIEGHISPVAPRVGGTVVRVLVKENDEVAAGDLLFELDHRDFEVALARAEADLAEAEAAVTAAETGVPIATTTTGSELDAARAGADDAQADVEGAQRQVAMAQAELDAVRARLSSAEALHRRAAQDLERYAGLVARDEISRQTYDAAVAEEAAQQAVLDSTRASLVAAEESVALARNRLAQAGSRQARRHAELAAAATAPQQVAVIEARAASARARRDKAAAAVERARLDLDYASVRSPVNGTVSNKRVEVGQVVRPGQPVLAVVARDEIWVVANFKETQLRHMRRGQEARIAVDAYPGTLRGRVDSIGAATGARFSLFPPENATGNFVKVVQRVPVKIVLEQPADPERPLRPGMSVVATVITRSAGEDSRSPASASTP